MGAARGEPGPIPSMGTSLARAGEAEPGECRALPAGGAALSCWSRISSVALLRSSSGLRLVPFLLCTSPTEARRSELLQFGNILWSWAKIFSILFGSFLLFGIPEGLGCRAEGSWWVWTCWGLLPEVPDGQDGGI